MTDITNQKGCPFCGKHNFYRDAPDSVRTLNCFDCQIGVRESDWNSRPIEDAQALQIDACREKIAELQAEVKLCDDTIEYGRGAIQHAVDCENEAVAELAKAQAKLAEVRTITQNHSYDYCDCWECNCIGELLKALNITHDMKNPDRSPPSFPSETK